jgi:hypothetical protein
MKPLLSLLPLIGALLSPASCSRPPGPAQNAERPPSIALIAPLPNSEVSPGGEIRVEAVVHNARAAGVTFVFNDMPAVTVATPPYKTAILIPNSGVLVARAAILGRAITSKPVRIVAVSPDALSQPELRTEPLNATPYVNVTISSPPYGSVYETPASIGVGVDLYADEAIQTVQLAANGAVVRTVNEVPPGTARQTRIRFDWRCAVPNEYRLTAIARMSGGRVIESRPLLVIVR